MNLLIFRKLYSNTRDAERSRVFVAQASYTAEDGGLSEQANFYVFRPYRPQERQNRATA